MSSLKSKVRFIIPLTMWQRFVNHEILLKRPFEVKEFEETFYEYAKKMTFEDFKRIVFANYDENVYKLEKPITVDYTRYYHDDKDHHHTYEYLSARDVWDIVSYTRTPISLFL